MTNQSHSHTQHPKPDMKNSDSKVDNRELANQERDSTGLAENSAQATEAEHALTVRQALALYQPAILWSMFFCIGQMMTAFDSQILGNLFALPAFQRDFGYLFEDSYIISAPWQTGLLMGIPIGQVVGSLGAGPVISRYGCKRTLTVCVLGTLGCIFLQFFARSMSVLLAGELLGGLVLGFYAVITPTYASEICPLALRGILTANINLFIVFGQLLANGTSAGTQKIDSHWAYSAPFAMQWVWPVLILSLLPFTPESPWWLVRKKDIDGARNSIKKIVSSKLDVELPLAMMIQTTHVEKEMFTGTSYWDLFKKVNRRRTEICTGVYTVQVCSGVYLIGYGVYFFQRKFLLSRLIDNLLTVLEARLPTDQAFYMGIGFLAVGVVGSISSWGLLVAFGHRLIYVYGLVLLTVLLFIIGGLDCTPNKADRPSIIWTQAAILIIWNFSYNLTIGPAGFSILCEASAVQVREKTIAFATAVQAAVGISMTIAVPYLINPDQADLGGKIAFFFGGLGSVSLVWVYFRVPETKSRTYAELDVLFSLDIPTRNFATYVLTPESGA